MYPAEAADQVAALLSATAYVPLVPVRHRPVQPPATVATGDGWTLTAIGLDHRVPAVGYRLQEADGRRMLPDRLERAGISGPDVGRLAREGSLTIGGTTVTLDDVSARRRGQVFAFVMDTRWCDAAVDVAAGADLLVCESTYLKRDRALAEEHAHLTARQAGELARAAGARRLVLTHYSQRYGDDPQPFVDEAREAFDDVVAAVDLHRIAMPPRR
jgi:ribonuclease Z